MTCFLDYCETENEEGLRHTGQMIHKCLLSIKVSETCCFKPSSG